MRSLGNLRSNPLNRSKQSGVVLVIGMIAMVALLAMAGLALDGGHMIINKTRLQNTADAAALNAAKVYELTSRVDLATEAVDEAIILNGDMPGEQEIKDAYLDGTIQVSIEFSNTLVPFTPIANPDTTLPWFIRVTMTNFRMPAFLVPVVGVNTLTVAASAVAGVSPKLLNVCDLAPVMLCGNPPEFDDPLLDEYFGYKLNDIAVAKYAAGGNKCDELVACEKDCGDQTCLDTCADQRYCVGDGNFQLVSLPEGTGANVVRYAAAGRYGSDCETIDGDIDTKPGDTVGPTVQGFNTRFGQYTPGPLKDDGSFPGDADSTTMPGPVTLDKGQPRGSLTLGDDGSIYVGDPDIPANKYPGGPLAGDYNDYIAGYTDGSTTCTDTGDAPSNCYRRIMAVPIGNCDGSVNGQGTVPLYGFACVFLIQPIVQKGNEANVYVQFIENCNSGGAFNMTPIDGPLPTTLILYKDSARVDS